MATETPAVQYTYASGSSNHVRPMKIVYPSGREIHSKYNAGADDNLSRVSSVASAAVGGTDFATYTYLGLGAIAPVFLAEADLRLDFAKGTTGDKLDVANGGGLDRFGRVVDLRWRHEGTTTVIDQIKHGYDRVSNRLWREAAKAASISPAKHLDELYVSVPPSASLIFEGEASS